MQCSSCGAQNPDNNRFCMQCGKQIPPAAPVAQQQGAPPNWSAPTQNIPQPGYVPPVPPPAGAPQQPVYQQPYGGGYYQQQQNQVAARKSHTGMKMVAGALAFIAGGVVVASTFLAWFSSLSGWSFMIHASEMNSASGSGTVNFLFAAGNGKFLFSGFWSLLFGGLMVIAGILLFAGVRSGRGLEILFSLLAAAVAIVNIIMVYTTGGPSAGVNAGIGLWLFAGFGILGIVAGTLGARST
jgi:zinc-ribbon domain